MKRIFLLFAVFLSCAPLQAQEGKKDKLLVGAYITSLYDMSLSNNSFSVDFWLWFNHKNDSLKPLETVEIVNAKKVENVLPTTEKKGGIIWATHKCRAEVKKQWNIEHFPFDRQELEIIVEEGSKDVNSLIYEADKANSKIDKSVKLEGWHISKFDITASQSEYATTYGDPILKGKSTYAHLSIKIVLDRVGTGLFFKMFLGVYIAFLIGLLVFWIDPEEFDSRIGLSVGSLFAAVGNKYIVDSVLPETVVFTLVDKVHLITFFFIFISLLVSVYTSYLHKQDKKTLAKKTDLMAFYATCIAYLLINVYMIYDAVVKM
jgi:hypothetical protein